MNKDLEKEEFEENKAWDVGQSGDVEESKVARDGHEIIDKQRLDRNLRLRDNNKIGVADDAEKMKDELVNFKNGKFHGKGRYKGRKMLDNMDGEDLYFETGKKCRDQEEAKSKYE